MSQMFSKIRLRDLRIKLIELSSELRHISREKTRIIYQTIFLTSTLVPTLTYLGYNTCFLYKYQQLVQMYA